MTDDGIRMEVTGIRSDLDAPVSVLGVVPDGDAGKTHVGCAALLRGGEPVSAVAAPQKAAVSDCDIHNAFMKYRYGYTPFIDRDSFMLAVKELLRGDK